MALRDEQRTKKSEGLAGQRRREDAGPLHLGRQDRAGHPGRLELDRPGRRHPGRVHHAAQRRRTCRAPRLRPAAWPRSSATSAVNGRHLAPRPRAPRRRGSSGSPGPARRAREPLSQASRCGSPERAVSTRRAPAPRGEVPRDLQAHAAEAAGDQVDPAGAASASRDRPLRRRAARLEAAGASGRPPQGHIALGLDRRQLGQQAVDERRRIAPPARRQVDRAAVQVRGYSFGMTLQAPAGSPSPARGARRRSPRCMPLDTTAMAVCGRGPRRPRA